MFEASGADLCLALGGYNLQFYPILPYFQHWGGWTSTTILFRSGNLVKIIKKANRTLFSPNSDEDQKKKVFNKNKTLFSPNLRSDVHPFKLLGGMQMWTILKLLGRYSQIIGGICPPHPPPLFRHPCLRPRPKTKNTTRKCSPKKKKKRVFAHKPRKFSAKFQAKKKGHDHKWQNGTTRLNRGGVEDTRLEAKAKDTKKSEAKAKAKDSLSEDRHSRGQGQECSRPRPRTKDTSASALQQKKKGLHKNFLGDLQNKTFSK